MFDISPNQAKGCAIATVFVLALGSFMGESVRALEPTTPREHFVFPQDEYGPMMLKRLKEIGGGPHGLNNGLAGVKWGAPLAGFSHMTLVEKMGRTTSTETNGLYRNGDEKVILNGAPVSPVRYWFVDEQLGSVSLSYRGRENWGRLKEWVEQWYGPLERPGDNPARFDAKLQQWVKEPRPITFEILTDSAWSGQLLWDDAATEVSLRFNPKTEEGELLVISSVLNELHAYEGVGGGDC